MARKGAAAAATSTTKAASKAATPKAAAKPAAAKKGAVYSAAKIKALQKEATDLGLIIRSNFSGAKLEEKIGLVKSGVPLDQVNPASRGGGTAKPKAATAAKAPAADGEKPARKARKVAGKKTFLVYAVEGEELSFVAKLTGASGPGAITTAVREEILSTDTPYVFLSPESVGNAVEVEAIPQETKFQVKATKVRKARKPRAPKDAAPTAAEVADSVTPPVTPPAPGEAAANPFANVA